MNETTTFRRVATTLTIGSFSLAALMGIVALLGGGDFGEGEAQVLLTTLIVGCASICMLCYLATAGTDWALIGVGGGLLLTVPVVTSLILVWGEWDGDSEGVWKLFGVGVVGAATLAQICMLLALAGTQQRLAVVLWSTVGLAVVLAILVSGTILGEVDAAGIWRLLGVTAILDVLGTLVTIALAKFGGKQDSGLVYAGREPDGGWWVVLSEDRATAIQRLARDAGRPAAELVDEAVDRYLALEAQT